MLEGPHIIVGAIADMDRTNLLWAARSDAAIATMLALSPLLTGHLENYSLAALGVSAGLFGMFVGRAQGEFHKAGELGEITVNIHFQKYIFGINDAIEKLTRVAPLEAEALSRRLHVVQTRQKPLFDQALAISHMTQRHERLDKWPETFRFLDELKAEVRMLPVEASTAVGALRGLINEKARYPYLRNLARREANKYAYRESLFPSGIDTYYRLLRNVADGRIGPSNVTFFDLMAASEHLRQGRKVITEYGAVRSFFS